MSAKRRRTPISRPGQNKPRSAPGPASNRLRLKAGSPSRKRLRSTQPNTRSARSPALPTGRVIELCRYRSNSGRSVRFDCTIASSSNANARMRRGTRRGSTRRLASTRSQTRHSRNGMPNSQANQQRRTLLLTGASRGIGHATVKRFSAAGWRVITCSRHPFPENCPWEAGPEDHIQVDLANEANTLEAIAETKRRLDGRELHALVNNAAISPKAEGGKRLGTLATSN